MTALTTREVVSAREAAKLAGLNERTIRRWIVQDADREAKQLPGAYRDARSGEYRVPVSALKPYLPEQLERPDGSILDTNTGEVIVAKRVDAQQIADLVTGKGQAADESLSYWITRAVRAETRLELLGQLVGDWDGGPKSAEHIAYTVQRIVRTASA